MKEDFQPCSKIVWESMLGFISILSLPTTIDDGDEGGGGSSEVRKSLSLAQYIRTAPPDLIFQLSLSHSFSHLLNTSNFLSVPPFFCGAFCGPPPSAVPGWNFWYPTCCDWCGGSLFLVVLGGHSNPSTIVCGSFPCTWLLAHWWPSTCLSGTQGTWSWSSSINWVPSAGSWTIFAQLLNVVKKADSSASKSSTNCHESWVQHDLGQLSH